MKITLGDQMICRHHSEIAVRDLPQQPRDRWSVSVGASEFERDLVQRHPDVALEVEVGGPRGFTDERHVATNRIHCRRSSKRLTHGKTKARGF